MSNVVNDYNDPNDEIINVEDDSNDASMALLNDTGENGAENSELHQNNLPAVVPAHESNEMPQDSLPPPQLPAMRPRQRMDDEVEVSSGFL